MDQAIPFPRLSCYKLHDFAMPIRAGQLARPWMDATPGHYAYRCTPLNIANTSGWEVLNTFDFTAEWNGGPGQRAITISPVAREGVPFNIASSHFGKGILTFHLGWLFRTNPGWAIWAKGLPNKHRHKIAALEGIVETEWLQFPFTMNWRFTKPGKVSFAIGDPIAFITLFPHGWIDAVQPTLHSISDDPDLHREFMEWRDSRSQFNKGLEERDENIMKIGWQGKYFKGDPFVRHHNFHINKRKLREPIER
ncbi:MAG TPA: DUF6065 family protein [Allosphingosinicella sp.]|nr:DUF6065 family protein [Allosphingosinicella sp.]